METKELKITIPENHKIDWQESAKQEKIVFKKIDNKPRSWEEYCNNYKGHFYYIQDDINNIAISYTTTGFISAYKNILPSKELAEAFIALMQLMSLRQAWIGDWKPDWKDSFTTKWCIVFNKGELKVVFFHNYGIPLSFPTKGMATDFMNCFKDLLNSAKDLL